MNIEELFAGIGVVIDDKVFSTDENGDRIVSIVRQLEKEKHFPLVKHDNFPSDEELRKLSDVSFLLIDWEIDNRETVLGEDGLVIQMPDTLKESNKEIVIRIVKTFLENNLAPIFIFSNQNIATIKKDLKKSGVDIAKTPVFVESKANLIGDGNLFDKIKDWVNSTSGVYVAKAWENALNKAKNRFFAEMAKNTSHWPKALYYSATTDTVDPGEEITMAVSQNIISRMTPIEIDQEQIVQDAEAPTTDEVMGIMKGQFFLEPASEVSSIVGDFYVHKEDGHSTKYYINIRPTCDCVSRSGNDGMIYLLECTQITGKKTAVLYNHNDGHFNETIGCAIVGPLYKGKIYQINFKTLIIQSYAEWREKKQGRILPPIINHIAERYGLYVQRQAMPRIPADLIPSPPQENSPAVSEGKEQNPGCMAAIINAVCKKK